MKDANNVASLDIARAKHISTATRITELNIDHLEYYKADLKSRLMIFIHDKIKHLKQEEAAKLLDITQARVSLIKNQRLSQFSVDRLIELTYKVGYVLDVTPIALPHLKALK
ncbi:MAG: putative conserved small protein [Idiomarinaceae bacterium HL-53]|nr:MAG: putative conserved small protein [Idiomarinaceae bacterium HL-53]CUS47674.1 Predicted DNA-binding protein, contains XRE-type HTH domain [Idiomarinaceae bacterium HL-53]